MYVCCNTKYIFLQTTSFYSPHDGRFLKITLKTVKVTETGTKFWVHKTSLVPLCQYFVFGKKYNIVFVSAFNTVSQPMGFDPNLGQKCHRLHTYLIPDSLGDKKKLLA